MRMLSANTIALVAVMILSSKLISGKVGELAYECVEVTTSSDDPSYFLLVWNVATTLQHFLFCKWQGILECLHRRFP